MSRIFFLMPEYGWSLFATGEKFGLWDSGSRAKQETEGGDSSLELPKAESFRLRGRDFVFSEYRVGGPMEGDFFSPGDMETGHDPERHESFWNEPSLLGRRFEIADAIPYGLLTTAEGKICGDLTDFSGQESFRNACTQIVDEPFLPPEWAKEIWEYVRLKRRKVFSFDSQVSCLRGLDFDHDGRLRFTIGEGTYSDSFYTNGHDGMRIGIADDERVVLTSNLSVEEMKRLEELDDILVRQYGKGIVVREAIASQFGGVPPVGSGVYNDSIGLAGTVITEDGDYMFVRRGSNVSVNQGVNCTASGAAEFDKVTIEKFGIGRHLCKEITREIADELGLKEGEILIGSMRERIEQELGIGPADYDLVPVGFIREFTRGGKPECMFLIRYRGTTDSFVRSVRENTHFEKREIDQHMFAFPSEQASDFLKASGASSFLQHKGLANLLLCEEYLKKLAENDEVVE